MGAVMLSSTWLSNSWSTVDIEESKATISNGEENQKERTSHDTETIKKLPVENKQN